MYRYGKISLLNLRGDILDSSFNKKYNNDEKQFFRAATASGLLMFLFYAMPYVLGCFIGFFEGLLSVDIGKMYENLNLSSEAYFFLDGIFQLIDLLISIFIVTRFYRFKPFSIFKKYGMADEGYKINDGYIVNYTLLDKIDYNKEKKNSRLTWDKILLIGIPVMYAINMAGGLIAAAITKIANNAGYKVPEANIDLTSNATLNVILFILRLCVLAPIIEEFLMRGCMLKILKPYGNWFAIIVTSVMFGLVHNNIGQGIGAVAGGILFGIIAVKSESIYPTIVLHGVNNFFASIQIILAGKYGNENALNTFGTLLLFIAFSGAIMFFLFFRKINLKNNNKSGLKTWQCVTRYIFNPAVLIYIAANLFVFIASFFIIN